MGLFGRKKKKRELDENGFDIERQKNKFHKSGIHRQTDTLYDEYGYDVDGFDEKGWNRMGLDKDGLDKTGYDNDGYDKDGFDKDGYDKDGYDKDGYYRDGYDRSGLNQSGFGRNGYNESTGTLYDKKGYNEKGYDEKGYDKAGYNQYGYDVDGYGKNGFDAYGINKSTGTLYDEDGYNVDGYNKNGFDRDGYDENNYHTNGKHKIEFIQTTASIDSRRKKPKLFLDSTSGDVHFEMTPFVGEEKFAKMVSGGNFDFYDNDSPAYILQIKFDEINVNLQEILVNVIRNTFPKKFQIFPTNYSIGAYWINDLITEENASYYLRRIIENYLSR